MSRVDDLLKELQHNTINFTIPLLSDPSKSIVFRPIKTKDQKTLAIMRDETKGVDKEELENFKAVIKLLDMVTIKCPIAFAEMGFPDFIWYLINIRAKSIGEVLELVAKCHQCNHVVDFNLDVTKDFVKIPRKTITDEDKNIKVTDSIVLTLGPLTLDDLLIIMEKGKSERESLSAALMIKKVEYGGEVMDAPLDTKIKIVDELTKSSLDKISEFSEKNEYGINLEKPYKCPKCGNEGKFKFESWQILNFF